MKKKLSLSTLFLLFSFFVHTAMAQDYPVIYMGDSWINDMIYVDDDTFVAVMSSPYNAKYTKKEIIKMNEEGEVLGQVIYADTERDRIFWTSEFMRLPDGNFGIFFTTLEEGIVRLKLVKVNQDLDLNTVVFDWEGTDYNTENAFADFCSEADDLDLDLAYAWWD